jgi:hypothetical protein
VTTDDDDHAVLAAYLPADEPPETPVGDLLRHAGQTRRTRRLTLLAGIATVAVLVGAAAILPPGHGARAPSAVGAAAPTTTVPRPSTAPPSATTALPDPDPNCQQSNGPSPAATALATWVKGRMAAQHPRVGPVGRIRLCYMDFGFMQVPPHTMNQAMLTLPLTGKATVSVTASADRWDVLPQHYTQPCTDDVITEHVACHATTLPDHSVLITDDYHDILIHGDPNDPNATRDKQAVRSVTRRFPDGREIDIGLLYDFEPAWKASFDRFPLTLAQLAAIVSSPTAVTFFPTGR